MKARIMDKITKKAIREEVRKVRANRAGVVSTLCGYQAYWHGYRRGGDDRPLDARQARRVKYDRSQDAYMVKHGYRVVRFWEHQVRDTPNFVVMRLRMELATQPDKRRAVAATKNNLDDPNDMPLFASVK